MKMSTQASEEEVKNAALALLKIQELTAGKKIIKVVVIPKKLVNIVI
jgi:leucyl-tRNA synthetase